MIVAAIFVVGGVLALEVRALRHELRLFREWWQDAAPMIGRGF